MKIQFLGAAGTVTGSKYLIEHLGQKILIDCGLFQGYKNLRLRNWEPLPCNPSEITAVILTHAHLDHSGYLPLLVKQGFTGPIYASDATSALVSILLPDSGFLQEEEARYANKRRYSKHLEAKPLYTKEDAYDALKQLSPISMGEIHQISSHFKIKFTPSGHIVGACVIDLECNQIHTSFSGDLGRPSDPVMLSPALPPYSDYLLIESTYGNRTHPKENPIDALETIILDCVQKGGKLIIPSFAVERAQILLYYIYLLKKERRIAHDLPVFLNSPMAQDVTHLYEQFAEFHKLSPEDCYGLCHVAQNIRDVDESKRLNELRGSAIIIAGSGMATGGRVLHHIKAFAPNSQNTILFAGYQAGGTRGALMCAGAEFVKIHGEQVPIRAKVINLGHLSAHADANEILEWLKSMPNQPKMTFIVHGEADASDALRQRIESELKWSVHIAEHMESINLD